jgi:formylglycine-generating enzyme required for sulfatase activity
LHLLAEEWPGDDRSLSAEKPAASSTASAARRADPGEQAGYRRILGGSWHNPAVGGKPGPSFVISPLTPKDG